jgi:hypothetical protein
MNIQMKILRALTFLTLSCGMAQATVITTITDFLVATDPTQTGRLSRNGIAQDWSGGEAFPGVINTTIVYHYQTYSINVGNTPFIQIEIDSLSTNTFLAAYDTAYLPNSGGTPNLGFDTNWLGDAGSSGNFFGTDPLFFQVIVPANHNLILVVNQTATGTTGLGNTNPYTITVEGFIDSAFTDPAAAPEPAGVLLSSGGLLVLSLAGFARKRAQSCRSAS